MKEAKALLVMTLIARRSSAWAHDIICSRPINDGEVSDDAMLRFANDIRDALDILTDPDRGNFAASPSPHIGEEEIARAFKCEMHRKCCTGAALDDVCKTLTDEELAGARAVLSLLAKSGEG